MGLFNRKRDSLEAPFQDTSDTKSKRTKTVIVIILSLLFLILIGGGFYYYTYKTNPLRLSGISGLKLGDKTASDQSDIEEVNRITKEVKQIMLLPDETPILATVTDLQKVSGQTFFEKAALGDKVLIFMQARKAILYRPSQKLIVEVGTVNNPGSTGTPSQENITVGEPTPIPQTTGFLPQTTPSATPSPSVTQTTAPTPTIPLSSEY